MEIIAELERLDGLDAPTCLTIGNFDGMHRGHQALMKKVVREAEKRSARSVAITFEPHPVRFFRGDEYPAFLLSTHRQRARAIEAVGIDILVTMTFNREVASMEPEQFIRRTMVERLNVEHAIVGYDFAFGRGRTGSFEDIERVGEAEGFTAESFGPVMEEDAPISSSRVRAHVRSGEVSDAEYLLGRPFALEGEIVVGDKRGRELGYPTANLQVGDQIVPSAGIYATQLVRLEHGETLEAVTSVGVRPTFYDGDAPVTVETFVIDAPDGLDLYGERVEVGFLEHLRDEEKFDGVEALVAQMDRDTEEARAVHARR